MTTYHLLLSSIGNSVPLLPTVSKVPTLSITVCACHVQWYTQRGTQRPHTDPHSQLVGVQRILVHPVLTFPSFSLATLRTWPLKDISDANILINVYHE